MHSILDIKLKHLPLILEEEVDFRKIIVEVFGYKKMTLKTILFKKRIEKDIIKVVRKAQKIDVTKISVSNKCKIKYPQDIDMISFQQRLEVDSINANGDFLELIVKTIAITSYSSHYGVDYNSDTNLFKKFEQYIYDQPFFEMIALYQHIDDKINESKKVWNRLFSQMFVLDKDFEDAGGPAILGRFSLQNLIKKTILDFGVSYKESFLMPYKLIKSNSLEDSSRGFVGNRMTQIKEANMRRQRKTN